MNTAIHIKPHHFLDIIKLYGAGIEVFKKDEAYNHDFYKIANLMIQDPELLIMPTYDVDDICTPCKYLSHCSTKHCTDTITHIKGLSAKDTWNKILDTRIIDAASISINQTYSAAEFCRMLYAIRGDISAIWKEDDPANTDKRIALFTLGAEKYLHIV